MSWIINSMKLLVLYIHVYGLLTETIGYWTSAGLNEFINIIVAAVFHVDFEVIVTIPKYMAYTNFDLFFLVIPGKCCE